MEIKTGDKVRVKSLDWFNENKNQFDYVLLSKWIFDKKRISYCGKVVEIEYIEDGTWYPVYKVKGSDFLWTDDMFDCVVTE